MHYEGFSKIKVLEHYFSTEIYKIDNIKNEINDLKIQNDDLKK